MKMIKNTPQQPRSEKTLLLAHGAGAPMDSPFMETIATGVARRGIPVCRFEFPYMQERRETGKKRPPDRAPKLLDAFMAAINACGGPEQLVIGGKSMGGRMATLVAAEGVPVAGVIALGYPFHPPGKPENARTEHLAAIAQPNLILQGTRDPFGKPEEVDAYNLPASLKFHWLEDGDHDFKPRVKSGRTHEQNLLEAVEQLVGFVLGVGE